MSSTFPHYFCLGFYRLRIQNYLNCTESTWSRARPDKLLLPLEQRLGGPTQVLPVFISQEELCLSEGPFILEVECCQPKYLFGMFTVAHKDVAWVFFHGLMFIYSPRAGPQIQTSIEHCPTYFLPSFPTRTPNFLLKISIQSQF